MINQENHGNKIFGRSNVPTVQLGSTMCMSYSNLYVIIELVLFCGCSDTNCLWLSRTSFVIPVVLIHLRGFVMWIFWLIRNFLRDLFISSYYYCQKQSDWLNKTWKFRIHSFRIGVDSFKMLRRSQNLKTSTTCFDVYINAKTSWRVFQKILAFSENLNFNFNQLKCWHFWETSLKVS